MTRIELEHIIRAAAAITNENELVIIGSQAILGQYPDAPEVLRRSMEADLYAPMRPEMSELIEGALGELSDFERTFGYRAEGVSEDTATLPGGWRTRLIPVRNENTNGATGWCLEVHDIAVAKYVAGREKDRYYIVALWDHELIDAPTMLERLSRTKLSRQTQERLQAQIRRDSGLHGHGAPRLP